MKVIALRDFTYFYAYRGRNGISNQMHIFSHKKGESFYGYDHILKKEIKKKNCKELK